MWCAYNALLVFHFAMFSVADLLVKFSFRITNFYYFQVNPGRTIKSRVFINNEQFPPKADVIDTIVCK